MYSSRKRIIPGAKARNRQASKKKSSMKKHPGPVTKLGKRPVPLCVKLNELWLEEENKLKELWLEEENKLKELSLAASLERVKEEIKVTDVEELSLAASPERVKEEIIVEEIEVTDVKEHSLVASLKRVKEEIKVTDVKVCGRDFSFIVVFPGRKPFSYYISRNLESDEEDGGPDLTVDGVTEWVYKSLCSSDSDSD